MRGTRVIGRRRLRLALPWLADAVSAVPSDGGAAARLPAAEWLAARGEWHPTPVPSWRQWLLAGAGVDSGALALLPAGPCVYAVRNGVMPQGTWACARPVHLLTALDHLRLSPETLVLDRDETAALAADLDRHLQGTGFKVHVADSGEWLLECAGTVECSTVEPALASGCNLRDLMPAGPDGARIRSLMNELQMLLHEHTVNERRAARGKTSVNSLWLWGFGSATQPVRQELPTLCTDDSWLAGLWRAHGTTSRALDSFDPARDESAAMILLGWSSPAATNAAECLAAAEARCFAVARAALATGHADHVELLLGDRAVSTGRNAGLLFWRRQRPLAQVLG